MFLLSGGKRVTIFCRDSFRHGTRPTVSGESSTEGGLRPPATFRGRNLYTVPHSLGERAHSGVRSVKLHTEVQERTTENSPNNRSRVISVPAPKLSWVEGLRRTTVSTLNLGLEHLRS